MKVLCLYNNICALELFEWIKNEGNEVELCSDRIDERWCNDRYFDLTVSYTYRYILSKGVLNALNDNVVNIHNSFLPYNKGADPNIWSIIDGTPSGVTLHYMSEKVDAGNIITQKIVQFDLRDTLKSSYYKLDREAKSMFKEAFSFYKYWEDIQKRPLGKGSYHTVNDGKRIKELINDYDILISEFKQLYNNTFGEKSEQSL